MDYGVDISDRGPKSRRCKTYADAAFRAHRDRLQPGVRRAAPGSLRWKEADGDAPMAAHDPAV